MLTFYGILPGISCVLFCRIFWIVTIILCQFYHYRYLSTHFYSGDLFNLMDCLSSLLAYAKVMSKFIVFWLNQGKLVKILTMMTEDWNDCANSEINMRETMCKAKLSDRITNAMIILHTMSVIAYSTRIILTDVDITDCMSEPLYIHKMELPFDVNTQRVYRMVLITQFIYCITGGLAAGTVNALLLTLTLHVGGQMDILHYWLTNLTPKKNSQKKTESVTANEIIQKHQKIIKFSETIENLYTYIALLQFASNTIMICSLAFLIVSAIGTPDAVEQIIRSLLFYTITNLEAFIYCYAGEYLNNKSKAIGLAAYNSTWYNLKPKDTRILTFIILRSQKQLSLTVGKMMNLSLEYFATIMNASGSYLSVMLAMQ
nr:PREDICTED: odorant receptor 4-like [Linepithema humile]